MRNISGPSKPNILFISPVAPAPNGTGKELRAWAWITSLQSQYRVHVLVAGESPPSPPELEAVASFRYLKTGFRPQNRWKRRLGLVLPLLAGVEGFAAEFAEIVDQDSTLLSWLSEIAPVRIVVFRMYLHRIAQTVRRHHPAVPAELDLDDLESLTRWSLAACAMRLGDRGTAFRQGLLAIQYGFLERMIPAAYEKLHLAAEEDRAAIPSRFRQRAKVFANRLRSQQAAQNTRQFRLLFVGSLGYAPNEEAALLAIELAQALQPSPAMSVTVAGRGASPALRHRLTNEANVMFLENPDDLSALYASALAVIVPLKAGGGTKYKTIEAFACRRAVVSTSEGVRGLGALPGEHYLPAETVSEFAAAIRRLSEDQGLRDRIAAAGYDLWRRDFSL